MRIVVTGSSGRVGRAIVAALGGTHDIVGIDAKPFSTTRVVGDFTDRALLERACDGADAFIHAANLHHPNIGHSDDATFRRVNVDGTALVVDACEAAGCRTLVFTSTTSLYGAAVVPGRCTWIDEETPPVAETIYHRTKLEAEALLEKAASPALNVRIVRMSRSFPEPAPTMALHRLFRSIDVRDVADAHLAALRADGPFLRMIASGATPFVEGDCAALASDPTAVLRERAPGLVAAFAARGWPLPSTIDRVYSPARAQQVLSWRARHGWDEVLAQLDRRSLEVLPDSFEATPDS